MCLDSEKVLFGGVIFIFKLSLAFCALYILSNSYNLEIKKRGPTVFLRFFFVVGR